VTRGTQQGSRELQVVTGIRRMRDVGDRDGAVSHRDGTISHGDGTEAVSNGTEIVRYLFLEKLSVGGRLTCLHEDSPHPNSSTVGIHELI
jgi:hypothetical protein